MDQGRESVQPDERLLRRIPEVRCDRETRRPTVQAFRPLEQDRDGISLFRMKYHSPEDIAPRLSTKPYYVGVVRAGDLVACGVEIRPDPTDSHCGHVIIPSLTFENRDSAESQEMQVRLAVELCEVPLLGPFSHHLAPTDTA